MLALAAITWLVYAAPAYVLYPLVFRVRFGRSAVAGRFPPRRLYDWIDLVLGAVLIGYSVWIVFGPRGTPISTAAGLAFWALGCGLRIWAVWTLGASWRIGQDESDRTTTRARTGPYRLMDHPINSALILVAIGQTLLTGFGERTESQASIAGRTLLLLAGSVLYFVAQARAEERYWRRRSAEDAPPPLTR